MGMTKREMEIEAAAPHDLGCFEWAAEEIQERAAAAGVEIDGDLEDTFRGMTVIAIFHQDMVEGTLECHCEAADRAIRARQLAAEEA